MCGAFRQKGHEIERRDNADELAVVHHGQRSDDMTRHLRGGLANGFFRRDRYDGSGHGVAHQSVVARIEQIAIGDQADHVLPLHDDQMMDVVSPEHLLGQRHGIARFDGSHLLAHYVSHSHGHNLCPGGRDREGQRRERHAIFLMVFDPSARQDSPPRIGSWFEGEHKESHLRLGPAFYSALIFLVACNAPPERRAEPAVATTTAPPVSATKKEVPRNVFINKVTGANPLAVKGRARTFENSVVVRARSGDDVLKEIAVVSVGEMGQYNPWTAQLWLTRQPGKEVTVEAFEYSARDGSVQSLDSQTVRFTVPPVSARLHFPAGDCTRFIVIERAMPKSISMARLLVEALVDGPTAEEEQSGASAAFPRGSAVRSVNLRDGVLTVDFNERLQNVGGSCAVQAIRESVTRTLRELPTVKKVVIMAGGREDLALQP